MTSFRYGALLAAFFALFTYQSVASTTTLTASPGSTLNAGTVLTLTAAVTNGVNPITTGQVAFCDAAAPFCTDIHLLGTAQITSAGTATLRFIPALGTHTYKAVFVGTSTNPGSTSSTATLNVTGTVSTQTTLTASGAVGNYTLTATVAGAGSTPPTGLISLQDVTAGAPLTGSSPLTPGASTLVLTTGSTPTQSGVALAAGDLNGDGRSDLITADSTGNLTIGLAVGDGTFTPLPRITLPASTSEHIALGDFNADGNLDIAITQSTNTVIILLGNGDGTFGAPANYATGSTPTAILAADFNSDGIPDLAISNNGSNTVTVLLGNGDGTFTAATPLTTGGGPAQLAVADFNADGRQDLAVTTLHNYTVTIFAGNGDGTFAAVAGAPITSFDITAVTTADFNADGMPDIAVSTFLNGAPLIYLGKVDGTFTFIPNSTTVTAPGGGMFGPGATVIGDFNADGIPDLAALNANSNAPSGPVLYLGNGDGTFSFIKPGAGNSYSALATGDFNSDGVADLVSLNVLGATAPAVVSLSRLSQTAIATISGITLTGVGSHQVQASYPGDATYLASVSPSIPLIARTTPPSLILAANPTTTSFGQQVTLSANLNPIAAGSLTTNGEPVTFFNGSTNLGVGTLNSGFASINLTALPTGTASLTATYPGDTSFLPTTSNVLPFKVSPATPVLSWGSLQSIPYGTPLPASDLNATASVPGTFTYTPAAGTILSGGPQTLTATFTPTDTTDYVVTTRTNTLIVGRAPSTTTLTASALTSIPGANVTFTAAVLPANTGTPTGSVQFRSGSTILTTVPLNGTSATYTTSTLPIGASIITAVYAGDGNFTPSISASLTETVGVPDFSITANPSAITIKQGQTGVVTLSLTPVNGYNQPVSFSCTSLPALVSCAFAPSILTPAGAAQSTQLTITTMAPTTAALTALPFSRFQTSGPIFAGLLLCMVPFASRHRRTKSIGLLMLLAAVLVLPLSGCSSGPSASSGPVGGTPTGTSSFTVAGGTASTTVSHSIPVTITVTN